MGRLGHPKGLHSATADCEHPKTLQPAKAGLLAKPIDNIPEHTARKEIFAEKRWIAFREKGNCILESC
jgi:hypothetical protein